MATARTILALAVALAALAAPALAQEQETPAPPMNKWSFAGPFGKYDRAQLQRGLKVYREVCQVCHGLKLVAFRTLADPGGPGLTIPQATAIAAEYQVKGEPDDQGEVKDRPGRLADTFPSPFPNDQAARARYNAVPPDLSVTSAAFPAGWAIYLRSTKSRASTTSLRCCKATKTRRRRASPFRRAASTMNISPATPS